MKKSILFLNLKRTSLFLIFLINLIAIIWLWRNGSSIYLENPEEPGYLLKAFGRLSGLLLQYLLLLQIILISRTKFIEQLFGFDKLNNLHRLIGTCLALLLISHPLLLIFGNAQINQVSLSWQINNLLKNKAGIYGAISGAGLFILVIFITTFWRKKIRYENWHLTHLFTYLAIGLAFSHQLNTGDLKNTGALTFWLTLNFLVFGLLILFRIIRPLWLFYKHGFYVEKIIRETPEVCSVYLKGKNLNQFHFKSGQYANLNFLIKNIWSPHPFSFSARANSNFLRFSIKNLGDFTSQIEKIPLGTKVILDGPLGLFTTEIAQKEKFLLIAGGIGITPIRNIFEELAQKDTDAILLYSNRNDQSIVFEKELDEISQNNKNLSIFYFVNQSSEDRKYQTGKINGEIIKKIVPDFFEREIYICGPPQMIDNLIKDLTNLGIKRKQIHYEKFSF